MTGSEATPHDEQLAGLSYPRLAARTRQFLYGQPRTVSVSTDGERVTFLRSGGPADPVHGLWVFDVAARTERLVADAAALLGEAAEDLPPEERAMRERKRESSGGVVAYATDDASRIAVFSLAGRLFRVGLGGDGVVELPAAGPARDPRPDPAGERVAYVTGGELHVIETDADGKLGDRLLAGEDEVSWGVAEFIAAEEMSRFRGFWWSPDGASILAARVDDTAVPRWYIADPANPAQPSVEIAYPHAGAANADVTLHVIDVATGERTEIGWDRARFPYVVTAGWDDSGCVLATVMDRPQQSLEVLGADPKTGEVQRHVAASDPVWVEVTPGTPALLPDGRLVWSDGQRLTAGGDPVTPPELYVRAYLGRTPAGDLLVEGTIGAPEENHVYTVPIAGGPPERLTPEPGWHGIVTGGPTTVTISRGMDFSGARFTIRDSAGNVTDLRSVAARAPYDPRPQFARVTERRLPTAVVYPSGHTPGTRLPVLMDPYGGPHHQEILAVRGAWNAAQWWADQGFAVVVVDGRGTPGISPEFERAIRGDLATPVLDDQVAALQALAAGHPDLDLARVGIRGWSFGGYLAALAVLRRPDVFHAAVAGAPVTDWRLYDTFYTERYLGLPDETPADYDSSSLIEDAPNLTRPLLLIHGLADDNVVSAHTLRLSSALLAAGRPHEVLPLTGVTHMASGETVAENLLLLQADFLRRHLTP
ncbi:MAG: peptidase [Actinomycetia bacterium]|nr:peptidase [Actinomycetes bacterium]